MFDPKKPKGVSIADIADGTSNTVLRSSKPRKRSLDQATKAIFRLMRPETRADQGALDPLGGHSRGGFNALFCDGAIRLHSDARCVSRS